MSYTKFYAENIKRFNDMSFILPGDIKIPFPSFFVNIVLPIIARKKEIGSNEFDLRSFINESLPNIDSRIVIDVVTEMVRAFTRVNTDITMCFCHRNDSEVKLDNLSKYDLYNKFENCPGYAYVWVKIAIFLGSNEMAMAPFELVRWNKHSVIIELILSIPEHFDLLLKVPQCEDLGDLIRKFTISTFEDAKLLNEIYAAKNPGVTHPLFVTNEPSLRLYDPKIVRLSDVSDFSSVVHNNGIAINYTDYEDIIVIARYSSGFKNHLAPRKHTPNERVYSLYPHIVLDPNNNVLGAIDHPDLLGPVRTKLSDDEIQWCLLQNLHLPDEYKDIPVKYKVYSKTKKYEVGLNEEKIYEIFGEKLILLP